MYSHGPLHFNAPQRAEYYVDGPQSAQCQLTGGTSFVWNLPPGDHCRNCNPACGAQFGPRHDYHQIGAHGPSSSDVIHDVIRLAIQPARCVAIPSNGADAFFRETVPQLYKLLRSVSSSSSANSNGCLFASESENSEIDNRSVAFARLRSSDPAPSTISSNSHDECVIHTRNSHIRMTDTMEGAGDNYRGTVPLNRRLFADVADHQALMSSAARHTDEHQRFSIGGTTASTAASLPVCTPPMPVKVILNRTTKYNHVCEYCGKRFAWNNDYKRHLVVHTRVKAFQCPLCDARFGLEHNMRKHVRLLHNDRTLLIRP